MSPPRPTLWVGFVLRLSSFSLPPLLSPLRPCAPEPSDLLCGLHLPPIYTLFFFPITRTQASPSWFSQMPSSTVERPPSFRPSVVVGCSHGIVFFFAFLVGPRHFFARSGLRYCFSFFFCIRSPEPSPGLFSQLLLSDSCSRHCSRYTYAASFVAVDSINCSFLLFILPVAIAVPPRLTFPHSRFVGLDVAAPKPSALSDPARSVFVFFLLAAVLYLCRPPAKPVRDCGVLDVGARLVPAFRVRTAGHLVRAIPEVPEPKSYLFFPSLSTRGQPATSCGKIFCLFFFVHLTGRFCVPPPLQSHVRVSPAASFPRQFSPSNSFLLFLTPASESTPCPQAGSPVRVV